MLIDTPYKGEIMSNKMLTSWVIKRKCRISSILESCHFMKKEKKSCWTLLAKP